jgi:hypothetical protein
MVTSGNLERLQRLNFGLRALQHAIDPGHLAQQLERYDPEDALRVARRVRATAGLDAAVDALLAIYHDVLREHASMPPDADAELRSAAVYLARVGPAQHRPGGIRTAALDLVRAFYTAWRGRPLVRRLARSARFVRWTASARRHWGTVD